LRELVTRAERSREEMLLFYEAATRASRRLYLSYPALDAAAQPLLPSPFLHEVELSLGPERILRIESLDLSAVPTDDEPLCEADFRLKAVADALEGDVALLAGLTAKSEVRSRKSEVENRSSEFRLSLAAGLEIIHLRQDRSDFGPADGVLQSDAARRRLLSDDFFPPSHVFSATALERYAACPFRFFLERVLKLNPVEDLALEFDVLERGRAAHEVLATFHRKINDRLGRPASPLELDESEFNSLLAAAVEESFPPEAEPKNLVRAALQEIDRRLVVAWLADYRRQCERYDQLWKDFETPPAPTFLETAFGRKQNVTEAAGDELPSSPSRPFEITRGGRTFHLSGRIDRIDVGVVRGQTVFNVLDYKTTAAAIQLTPESVRAGTTLQLPLYAIAIMELLLPDRDALPWQAAYWYVRADGFKPRQALRMYGFHEGRIELDEGWEDIRDSLGDTVAALIESIRHGRFPVYCADENCAGRCPYHTVCRIHHVRSLEKKPM
jgi:ATP-dependent helicase/nuclease subunit B